MILHKALVEEIASNKPNAATAFNLPDSATAPARSFDSALATASVVPYHATNGTDWEDGIGTFTAGAPDTLTRNSILDSSTGSAIDFSAGNDVTVRIVWPASIATEADLNMRALAPGGRLTLSSGNPDYQPLNVVAVSGQDTSADTITVTAHGWIAGTMVKSSATSGGITAGTQYYVGNVTTNTVSLHTTLADALAGTSKLDITGAVSTFITANGIAGTSIYYTPYNHNLISLWNGYRWQTLEFSELTLAIGTVTASKPFDVFAYIDAGAAALEKLEWTSDTVRATDIARQDGRWCKSGDKTRLFIGTFYSRDTTSTENSNGKLFLVNFYNQVLFSLLDVRDSTTSWTYSTAAWHQVNASAANQIEFIIPIDNSDIEITVSARVTSSAATFRDVNISAGLDSTSAPITGQFAIRDQISSAKNTIMNGICYNKKIGLGKHYAAALEFGGGSDTQTWTGSGAYQRIAARLPW